MVTEAPSSEIAAFLASQRPRVEAALARMLPEPVARVRKFHDAMAYSLLGTGKRVRPILCLTVGEALGAAEADLLPVAVALEMIHTYSLIHDDLPAMDDDDLRRGRPSNHRVYGEAMAILAGDGLLTLAFEVIASQTPSPELIGPLVAEVAAAAGASGMVGGQAADLLATGHAADSATLEFVHLHKTAALIRAAVVSGALAARADAQTVSRFRDYGEAIGLAFQVTDDILDVVGNSQAMGKAVGKDAAIGKLTYPGLHGLAHARKIAGALCDRAHRAVDGLPGAGLLCELADFIVARSH